MGLLNWLLKNAINSSSQPPAPVTPDQYMEEHKSDILDGNMSTFLPTVRMLLGHSDDFQIRHFRVFGQFDGYLLYFSNIVDKEMLNTSVMRPLMRMPDHLSEQNVKLAALPDIMMVDCLYNCQIVLASTLTVLIEAILSGDSVLLVDGLPSALLIENRKVDKRSIEQPATEQVIRGPREGFIEQLATNIGLLRYRLQTANFCVKTMKIGRVSRSSVAVCHIKGIANPALLKEVNRRLSSIEIDGIMDSGYLEQLIEDNHYSPFPQVANTERPDKVVANLLEGRVAIMVDGSPFALIVPAVFNQFYQVTEDYAERFLLVSFIRLSRLVALIFSLITPSLYVAVISFNPELIPTKFAVAVAGARAGVPFPSVIEVLLMEVSMEVLREATVRLPQQVGGALSIVGVLVIGQAAVSAGFVSPITVVVIALTTIGSFATPAYNAALALRLLRFPLVLLAGTFGLYGVMIGLIVIANHLLSLKSFGVPYMSPLVPGYFEGMKDTVTRSPLWWMKKRPAMFHPPNDKRVGGSMVDQLKEPSDHPLDPLIVGDQKGDSPDGTQTRNNRHSGSGDSD